VVRSNIPDRVRWVDATSEEVEIVLVAETLKVRNRTPYSERSIREGLGCEDALNAISESPDPRHRARSAGHRWAQPLNRRAIAVSQYSPNYAGQRNIERNIIKNLGLGL
jgi:hypothetical protein